MARWTLADRLNLLLVALMIATAWGPMATCIFDFNHEPGCDTIQFYVAGQMVNRGEGHRLFDQPYFQEMQGPIVGDAGVFYSLYPPITAVLAAPWARLSYHAARNLWWIVEVTLILVAGWMLYRQMDFPKRWRVTAMLALATIFPIWVAVRMGQTTPVWLLTLLGGIELHRRNHRLGAGLLLSLLAMKPQLAAPVFVWLLFRRDVRVIFGMMLGAAAQVIVSAIVLGPEVSAQYIATLLSVGGAIEPINFSPAFEQSVGGTLKNLLITNGWRQPQTRWPALLAQLAVLIPSSILLFQAVMANRKMQSRGELPRYAPTYEYVCLLLFLLLATPHLLLYDTALAAIPIVFLWSSPGWRMGIALYLSVTVMAAFVSIVLGVSVLLPTAFWLLFRVSGQLRSLSGRAACDARSRNPASRMATAT